jgi:hypothetical protein
LSWQPQFWPCMSLLFPNENIWVPRFSQSLEISGIKVFGF